MWMWMLPKVADPDGLIFYLEVRVRDDKSRKDLLLLQRKSNCNTRRFLEDGATTTAAANPGASAAALAAVPWNEGAAPAPAPAAAPATPAAARTRTAPTEGMPRVSRVLLRVTNLDDSVEFYTKVGRSVGRSDAAARWCAG